MEGRTYGEVVQQEGEGVASRAEVIAAMNCLIHHLKNEEVAMFWIDFFEGVIGDPNWNILDWDPGEGAFRLEAYTKIAKGMSDAQFEGLCQMFLSSIKNATEVHRYEKGQIT